MARHLPGRALALIAALVFVLVCTTSSSAAGIGPYASIQELNPAAPKDFAMFGNAVALSADGNTAVVGAPYDTGVSPGQGAAYIFERGATSWSMVARLTDNGSTSGAYFGYSAGVSADGGMVVIGSWSYGSTNPPGSVFGSALIFERPAGGWASTGAANARLTPSVAINSIAYFGQSVAISADSTTIAVGAPGNTGTVYVYERPIAGWATATEDAQLTSSHVQASSFKLGTAVAVSSDGSTIAAGAPSSHASDGDGIIHVYERPGGGWASSTEQAQLTVVDAYELGSSVAISADGAIIAAGSPRNIVSRNGGNVSVSNQGRAYVFVQGASSWASDAARSALTDTLQSGLNSALLLGTSIAVSADGSVVVVGAPGEPPGLGFGGAALVYRRLGASWTPMVQRLTLYSSEPVERTQFGFSLSISSNGETLLVGQPASPSINTYQGRAEILEETIRATVSLPLVVGP